MKLLSIFVGILSLAEAQKSKARSNDEKIRVQAARNRDKINAKVPLPARTKPKKYFRKTNWRRSLTLKQPGSKKTSAPVEI